MGVPLVQQMSEVRGHVPRYGLQLIWVHLTGLQPLQIQHVLLTVGQLVNMGRDRESIYCERTQSGSRILRMQPMTETVTSFSSQ